jgi:predicted TPR repeat methyltransferase
LKNNFELPDGYAYEGPFIKQVKYEHFDYTVDYKARQSTNVEMSYFRLGWLSSSIAYDEMSKMNVVDIGSGNGVFVDCAKKVFKRVCGYDLCGESISEKELMDTNWDLIVMSDVLEHYSDINDFLLLKWDYAMVSFPETPKCISFEELREWRHFKPNEHLYYLDLQGMRQWLANTEPSIEIVNHGHFEDHIRSRWNDAIPNITTVLLRRKK